MSSSTPTVPNHRPYRSDLLWNPDYVCVFGCYFMLILDSIRGKSKRGYIQTVYILSTTSYLVKKVSEYDQEIPQSQTADFYPRHREEEPGEELQDIYSTKTPKRQ